MENPAVAPKAPADSDVAGEIDWAARFRMTEKSPLNPKTPFDPDIGEEDHDVSTLMPPESGDDHVCHIGKEHCLYDPFIAGAICERPPVIKEVISSRFLSLSGDKYGGYDCVCDDEDDGLFEYGPDFVFDSFPPDFDSDDEDEDEDEDEDDGYHTPEDCVFDSFAPGKVCPPAPKAKRTRLS